MVDVLSQLEEGQGELVGRVGKLFIERCWNPRSTAGEPVDISLDQLVQGPHVRAANGKLFVAENHGGKISTISVNRDKASVTVIKDGLRTPTGVEPAGDTLWITGTAEFQIAIAVGLWPKGSELLFRIYGRISVKESASLMKAVP